MILTKIDHLIPNDLEDSPTQVIGFIYHDGRREYRPYPSLEGLYLELLFLDVPIQYIPDYLIMADGSVLVYVHQLFYQTFSLQAFTEPELREMIDLSNFQNH